MNGRILGAVVLMLVVGAAGGYAVAARDEPDGQTRTAFDGAAPVKADNPKLPVEIFRQDPDDDALEAAIPLADVVLTALNAKGKPTDDQLSSPAPDGWTQTQIGPAEWRFTVPGNDARSFGLRVEIIADLGRTVDNAVQSRESELRSALAQGSFTDLDIKPGGDEGFVAEYVQDGYQRFSLERFFSGPDGLAYATVAAYGRARDVTGLTDLLERVFIGLRAVQSP